MEKLSKSYEAKIQKLGKTVDYKWIRETQQTKIEKINQVRQKVKTSFTKTTKAIKKSVQSTMTKIEERQCQNA